MSININPITGTPAEVFGTPDAVPQGTPRRWTKETGEMQTLVWRGFATALRAVYLQLQTDAITDDNILDLDFDPGKGSGTLRATVKGATPFPQRFTEYEMFINEMQSPIENHSYFSSNTFRGANNVPLTDAQLVDVLSAYSQHYGLNTAWNDKQKYLYALLLRGCHDMPVYLYVLRATTIDAKTGTMRADWADVGTVQSPPNTSTVNALLGAIPTCEWLKKPPAVRKNGNSKLWTIEQEWWGAQDGWSAILYGGTRVP
jgi:hypothetical protein